MSMCTASDAGQSCAWRYQAVRTGQFYYSVEGHGWLWYPSRSFPTLWRACPACGGSLPTLTSAAEKLVREQGLSLYGDRDDEC